MEREIILHALRDGHRQRQRLLRAEGNLTRQVKALCRAYVGGDLRRAGPVFSALERAWRDGEPHALLDYATPFLRARLILHEEVLLATRGLRDIVRALPVWTDWAAHVRGLGETGVAMMLGELGDPAHYPDKGKVWKRMGLAVGEDGRAQRRVKDPDKAVEMGYSPQRRSIMHQIGDSLMKAQNEYREFYLVQKAELALEHPEASRIHVHRMALRKMEKRLLRDLWQAWKRHPLEMREAADAAD